MNMNAKISTMILAKMAAGMTVREAINAVLGAGTVDKVIADVYAVLQAKAVRS